MQSVAVSISSWLNRLENMARGHMRTRRLFLVGSLCASGSIGQHRIRCNLFFFLTVPTIAIQKKMWRNLQNTLCSVSIMILIKSACYRNKKKSSIATKVTILCVWTIKG